MTMIPLSMARSGPVKVVKINGGKTFRNRLRTMGLRENSIIFVVSGSFFGPVIIQTGGTRIGIGVGMANKIIVEPLGR